MLVLGLVGGIGSGKSTVADFFEQLGAKVIKADQIGHEVLTTVEVESALRQRWGNTIFGLDGRIDRKKVAERVFAPPPTGPQELAFLESITHPQIGSRIRQQLQEYAASGNVQVVMLDAAILLESGWGEHCDHILFVEADKEQRLQRAFRRGWTAEQLAARESAQLSLEEKRKLADWVIDNSGSLDHTFAQLQQIWHSLDLPRLSNLP
jgi:dephospho-CoA kinase